MNITVKYWLVSHMWVIDLISQFNMYKYDLCVVGEGTRRVLISSGLEEPRAIVVDPTTGWMYWTDWGKEAKIERSWMDGTHRSNVVDEDIVWPNGLAIDTDEQRLYW